MMLYLLSSLLLFAPKALALPLQAAGCAAGQAAVAGGHVTRNPQPGNGTLADASLGVRAIPLTGPGAGTAVILDTANPTTLVAEQETVLEIYQLDEMNPIPFRGFLFRLGAGDGGFTTEDALFVTAPVAGGRAELEQSQLASVCLGLQTPVGGVCHNLNDEKEIAGTFMNFPQADTNVPLDITVVARNCAPNSPVAAAPNNIVEPCDPTDSTYYFSGYTLNFDPAPSPSPTTPAPSPAPTMAPTASAAAPILAGGSPSFLVRLIASVGSASAVALALTYLG